MVAPLMSSLVNPAGTAPASASTAKYAKILPLGIFNRSHQSRPCTKRIIVEAGECWFATVQHTGYAYCYDIGLLVHGANEQLIFSNASLSIRWHRHNRC